ncbi:MAG: uncharacterized protein A8A55_0789 [Amphiamblys sp. WSBS2006]|nr:MAG: uncharacterized protein A8A55_0789 [Amphiamblys sp. WSBS2006]
MEDKTPGKKKTCEAGDFNFTSPTDNTLSPCTKELWGNKNHPSRGIQKQPDTGKSSLSRQGCTASAPEQDIANQSSEPDVFQ